MSWDAVRLCDDALRDLSVLEDVVGEGHADVAVILNNLAVAVLELSLSPASARAGRPLFERAIEILERIPACGAQMIATVMFNAAAAQCLAHEWCDAQLTYVRAIEVLSGDEPRCPGDVAAAIDGLSYAIFYAGEEDAWHESPPRTRTHLDALAGRLEAALGPDHLIIATVLDERAELGLGSAPTTGGAIMQYYSTGTPQELLDAIEARRRSLAIRTHTFGQTHEQVSGTLATLAALHRGLGDEELARELEQQAQAVFDAAPAWSPDDPVRPFLRPLVQRSVVGLPRHPDGEGRLAMPSTGSPTGRGDGHDIPNRSLVEQLRQTQRTRRWGRHPDNH